jgi:hypothetical protein
MELCKRSGLCVSILLNDVVSEVENRGVLAAYPVVNVTGFNGDPLRVNGMAVYTSIATHTGGDVFLLDGCTTLQSGDQRQRLQEQLRSMVALSVGSDIKIKVRCSRGVRLGK